MKGETTSRPALGLGLHYSFFSFRPKRPEEGMLTWYGYTPQATADIILTLFCLLANDFCLKCIRCCSFQLKRPTLDLNGRCFAIQGASIPMRFSEEQSPRAFVGRLCLSLHKAFILQRVIKLLSTHFIPALEKTLSDVNVHLCSFQTLTPAHTGQTQAIVRPN